MSTAPVIVVVDVGNSHTIIGVFRGEEIIEYWRLTTRTQATADEVLLRISGLLNQSSKLRNTEVTHIGLSTVVPMLERPWAKALNYLFEKPVKVVSARNCLGLSIDYPVPDLLGSDRISNVLALRENGYETGIVVDMGTATTFDVMKDGRFKGGIIAPGITVGLETLIQKTARLMPVTLDWTDKFIANNTDDALRTGVLYGFLGQLEYLLNGIIAELDLDNPIKVFSTGGWSNLLMKKTNLVHFYDPYLTLRGVRLVALQGEEL
ncbi:MAG: type III pantothenate kinase [Fibrobacter sp.]|mgnify:CR=1 FL=1|nr:type III pantothenate kinase [Fibrobacter sp.]